MPVHDWFMSKVDVIESGCWEWRGYINRKRGYGIFYDADKGQKVYAHHYLVPLLPRYEDVGVKMEYDHLCRNIICVNPEHLEIVTKTENLRRQFAALGADTTSS